MTQQKSRRYVYATSSYQPKELTIQTVSHGLGKPIHRRKGLPRPLDLRAKALSAQ